MITADTMETFPECPTFGFTAEPMYFVKVIERDGGFERLNRRWARPRYKYSAVPMGSRADEDIQNVLYFWHAVGGRSTYFRFRDYSDYKSCRVHADVSALDQPMEATGDSPSDYQLVKVYEFGSLSQTREIRRPRGDTIIVANASGVTQAASRWTLDEATGILTTEPSFVGTPASWGGEFDVPVRFDSDFPMEIVNKGIHAVNFSLVEKRES